MGKKEKICGIYSITCLINNKIYIGQSVDIKSRFINHRSKLKTKSHRNMHLQRSYDKYGKDNFKFKIIEECLQSELDDREIYWISFYKSNDGTFGFNAESGGTFGQGGLGRRLPIVRRRLTLKDEFIPGVTYSRLTIVDIDEDRTLETSRLYLTCRCSCKNITSVLSSDLKSKRVQSCGCLREERFLTHGLSGTPLYNVWLSHIKNNKDEIEIFKEWCDDFCKFKLWAENNNYIEGFIFNRLDKNQGYLPDNCNFIPRKDNITHSTKVEMLGVVYNSIQSLADNFSIPYRRIQARYNKGKRGNDLITEVEQLNNTITKEAI